MRVQNKKVYVLKPYKSSAKTNRAKLVPSSKEFLDMPLLKSFFRVGRVALLGYLILPMTIGINARPRPNCAVDFVMGVPIARSIIWSLEIMLNLRGVMESSEEKSWLC